MPVPEAAVHEDHGAVLWQHDIRSSRQSKLLKPESQTHPM